MELRLSGPKPRCLCFTKEYMIHTLVAHLYRHMGPIVDFKWPCNILVTNIQNTNSCGTGRLIYGTQATITICSLRLTLGRNRNLEKDFGSEVAGFTFHLSMAHGKTSSR